MLSSTAKNLQIG